MIDLEEVNKEIAQLERYDITYRIAEKLAILYTVRDANKSDTIMSRMKTTEESEFMEACNKAPIEDVLCILDEHMTAVKMLYPKEYSLVINRIKEKEV